MFNIVMHIAVADIKLLVVRLKNFFDKINVPGHVWIWLTVILHDY